MNRKSIGSDGESLALAYLKRKGYKILRTNYRSGRNEIDIIARIEDFLVFVEVKYRSSLKYGYPEEMVTGKQEDRIRDAAENFLVDSQWNGNIRFDIIALTSDKEEDLYHVRDAF